MAVRTVLFLTPSSRLLGARRSLLQLATNLDPERYRPVVATQTEGDLVDALREAKIETRVLFLGWWRKGRYMLTRPWSLWRLGRLVRETGADLIHCNEFFSCPYAVRAAKRAGAIPVISHMRLSITERRIRNYDLRRAQRVLCVSKAAARDFEIWPDWRERVEVVYNGVDLEDFRSDLTQSEARSRARLELGLGDKDFVAGMFALLSPRKRQHLLLRAAAQAREKTPRLKILIVGSAGPSDSDYERDLHKIVEEYKLEDTVRFIPFQKDIIDLYRASDVNVLVSDREGFGRTIIEAGALGVPSIGSRVGGIPELIIEGQTGHLVSADDDGGTQLANCLSQIAENPDAAKRLGAKARARVESEFSIERHVRKVMGIYDKVIERA